MLKLFTESKKFIYCSFGNRMTSMRLNVISYLENRHPVFWVAIGFLLIAIIAAADVFNGIELSFRIFYFIPIILVTWYLGRNWGFIFCITSAFAWFFTDTLNGHKYVNPKIHYWNALMRLCTFMLISWLLPTMKKLEFEKRLSQNDYLTGAMNRRYLIEVLQKEIFRFQRYQHPFSLAYIDLDNFKPVNDNLGHKIGDAILCAVVGRIQRYLRKTDSIARLGGDEFLLVLPETDQFALPNFINRISNALLEEMFQNQWPVTFSIGVLTCSHGDATAEELIDRADSVMYAVKKNGKNGIAFAEYHSSPRSA